MSGNGFDPDFASAGQWARLYRAHGVQVVPAMSYTEVRKGQSWKRPLLKSWTDFQDTLVPDAVFERWYGPGGQYATRENMGVITGRASNNLFVIDLDTHRNASAAEWWRGLLAVHNNSMDLETVEQRTGGGGLQKLFRAPAGWVAPTNKTSIGVDIRGQGGFAMLAPSLHESGVHYEWLDGRSPDDLEVTIAPDWLLSEVEQLVCMHGGGQLVPSNGTEKINTAISHGQLRTIPDSPVLAAAAQYDAFGHQIDARESKMRDLVWGSVVDWYRQCPIKPSEDESRQKADEKYRIYEGLVAPQEPWSELNKTYLLDHEGRGPAEFRAKWQYAMRQWYQEVAEEARKPAPRPVPVLENEFPAASPPLALRSAFPIVEREIPVRDWIVPGLLLKRNLSVLVAPPASGKSLLTLQLAIAVALGMAWGGWHPRSCEKVLVINAEDDFDEMRRRLFAAATAMKVNQADLVGKVMLADAPESIVIAKMDSRTKSVIRTPLIEDLVTTILANGISLVIADPFAETFEGDENSNSEMKWAGILWREVARRIGGSLLLVHHTKKYAGDMAGNADASRGGGALIGTARILSTLFTMTEDEAKLFNIPPEERDQYVRFDDAKANHSAKGPVKWFRKVTVSLNNGSGLIPGDDVGVLQPWKPPGVMDGITARELGLALETIGRGIMDDDGRPTGQLYGPTVMSKDRWAGKVLELVFGIPEDRAKGMIKFWLESGVLYTEEYEDPQQRKTRTGVKFDASKRPDTVPEVFK